MKKAGPNAHYERQVSPRQRELPFDSERKMMTVIVKADPTHPFNTYTRGRPTRSSSTAPATLTTARSWRSP
ncbi:hypothetical protein [Limosilactobacillus fermentum]